MTGFRRLIALFLAIAGSVAAQPAPKVALCSKVIGVYPIGFNFDSELNLRPRFEIRSCGSADEIQLVGFKANAAAPSLVELLIQTGTLLLMQKTAGSSSPTYIAQFQNGVPVLLSREDGIGGVKYKEDPEGYAIIVVPQKVVPGPDGRFPRVPPHRYRLKILE